MVLAGLVRGRGKYIVSHTGPRKISRIVKHNQQRLELVESMLAEGVYIGMPFAQIIEDIHTGQQCRLPSLVNNIRLSSLRSGEWRECQQLDVKLAAHPFEPF